MAKRTQGKLKVKKWRQVLQFFTAYLVAAWTFLQFLDWILNRYSISPYWVEVFIWLFVGISPSLIIYLYHRDRINKRILLLREKIIFPLNVVVIALGLYFGFGTADLGATTKTIAYTTESGEERNALITKEEFRTGFHIYNFETKTADSTNTWLDLGISLLLYEDLLQNKNLSPEVVGTWRTSDKVRIAKYFHDFYVDGEFEIKDSLYTITTYIRNAKNAKIIEQKKVEGTDLLDLIDEITGFVINTLDSKEFNNPKYLDLKVREFTSSNLKALEYYRYQQWEKAVKEDSTFALAYLNGAEHAMRFSTGRFEERALAEKAYQYRDKLPLQKQGEALILKYMVNDEYNKAEEIIKLQLEVDPNNDRYNNALNAIYGRTRNVEAYTQRAYDSWEDKKNRNTAFDLLDAALIREDYDLIFSTINTFQLLQPNDDYLESLKLVPQLMKGDAKAAKKTLEKTKLLHPDWDNLTKAYDSTVNYLAENKAIKADLEKFEGNYRFDFSEQITSFWVHNNTVLSYSSNQSIIPWVLGGDDIIVGGHLVAGRTWKNNFLKDDSGSYYACRLEQNDDDFSSSFLLWKIDDTISEAEQFLRRNELDSAKVAYEKAIKANPEHYYLKEFLSHINYIKSIDSLALSKQFNEVAGTYGPRTFWVENGKLFYKREAMESGQVFPKIEVLPVSKDRYINMTNLRSQFVFTYTNDKVLESLSYQYILVDGKWELVKSDLESNTFTKD